VKKLCDMLSACLIYIKSMTHLRLRQPHVQRVDEASERDEQLRGADADATRNLAGKDKDKSVRGHVHAVLEQVALSSRTSVLLRRLPEAAEEIRELQREARVLRGHQPRSNAADQEQVQLSSNTIWLQNVLVFTRSSTLWHTEDASSSTAIIVCRPTTLIVFSSTVPGTSSGALLYSKCLKTSYVTSKPLDLRPDTCGVETCLLLQIISPGGA
jgi:hypothetical protein